MKSPDSIITRSEADALFRGEFVRGKRMVNCGYSNAHKEDLFIIQNDKGYILQHNLRGISETFKYIRSMLENFS